MIKLDKHQKLKASNDSLFVETNKEVQKNELNKTVSDSTGTANYFLAVFIMLMVMFFMHLISPNLFKAYDQYQQILCKQNPQDCIQLK
jgi:hypothetical protein